MASIYGYSATAASNNSAAPDGAPENMAPSGVNDTIRKVMANLAEFAIAQVVGGTADALTLTPTNTLAAYVDGMQVHFRAANANATTTPTLAISGLTARTIVKNGGSALVAGDIAGAGAECIARYNLANTRWELLNPKGGSGTVSSVAMTVPAGMAVSGSPITSSGTLAVTGGPDYAVCNGRLTLTSGTAVTTADVTAAGTLYFTPYKGNRIGTYSGTAWTVAAFTEKSLALTLTSGKPYDIFIVDSTLALEALVWTNGTTRATALTLQDGVLVKSGATTRRYLGTIYASGSNTTEDSDAKRFVWNMYNQKIRTLRSPTETTDNWSYTTATLRQANANTANKAEWVRGLDEDLVSLDVICVAYNTSANNIVVVNIGVGSTSTAATGFRNALMNGLICL